MLLIFKKTFWSLKDKIGRFNYLNGILRLIPGVLGFELRNRIIPKYFQSCGPQINIHEGVRFRGVHKLNVGTNVEIGVDNFLQASGGITIGNDVMLGPGVKIWSVNHNFKDFNTPINQQGYEYKEVGIDDGVWLGANVFVMPGAVIPKGSVVSAGSVVGVKKLSEYSIIAGNPCRVIGNRKK
jgi:acetyltransferase-like isoleucine patch superfamily enzyme